jgi:acyl transferase domain-containing protein
VRRSHHDHRLAVVAETVPDAVQALRAYTRDEAHPYVFAGYALPGLPVRTVFLFSGQGGHWPGTGRALIASEPVFRDAIEECDSVLQSLCGWSLVDEFQRAEPRFEQAVISQPAHFSLQVALTALLRHWGVRPDAVVGASLGEVAAAYVAGALSLEDAMRVVVERSRILQEIAGRGAMVAVELPAAEIEPLLEHYRDSISIAAINSPTSTLVSGEAEAIDSLLSQLETRGIFFRRLALDYPSHSPLVAPYLDSLKTALAGLQPLAAHLQIVSTVSGADALESEFDASYWVRNLREPVRLASAIGTLAEQGYDLFIELGPHPVQSRPAHECFQALGRRATILPTLRRDEPERQTLLGTLGALYVHGLAPDWGRVHSRGGRVVPLPSYAWHHERYWVAKPKARRQFPVEKMPPPEAPLPVSTVTYCLPPNE